MKLYISASTLPDFQSLYDFSSFHQQIDDTLKYFPKYKEPIKSSLCKRLNNKPINQLTLEDIAVLYTMYWTWYRGERYSQDGDFLKWLEECWNNHEEDFRSCYDWVHSFTFPLKIYRAVTDKQELSQDISGRARAWSWTTDPNLYTADNSIFKRVGHIYSAEVDASAISNIDTVQHYVSYSARPEYGRYPENEITLKKRFKMSDLHNLTKIK